MYWEIEGVPDGSGTMSVESNKTLDFAGYEVGVTSIVLPKSMTVYGDLNSKLIVDGSEKSLSEGLNKGIEQTDLDDNGMNSDSWWFEMRWLAPADREFFTVGRDAAGVMQIGALDGHSLQISGKLALLLGFANGLIDVQPGGDAVVGDYPFRVPYLNHVYVYSDLVRPSLIADTQYNLVVHAGVTLRNPAVYEVLYNPREILYRDLTQTSVKRLSLTVADGTGNPINTLNPADKYHFTLHFKKRNN